MLLRVRSVYNYIRMHKNDLKVPLTASEERLFATLLSYTHELKLPTVMRVAGGWVRDKVPPITPRSWARSPTISTSPSTT